MKDQFCLTPYFLDQPLSGLKLLLEPDWQVNDPLLSNEPVMDRMADLYHPLAKFVHESILDKKRPVSIAGDCCSSIGVLGGIQQAGINPTLIWFDAHGDFNTWETTPSGFLGGMPLAMIAGRGEQTILEKLGVEPLPEEQIFLSDARDLDPDEHTALLGSRVNHLANVGSLLDHQLPEGPLYVHFDTDVLDQNEAPAMNYPAPDGPTAASLQRVFSYLAQTKRIIAVSLSSWNPDLDEDGISQEVCMGLLKHLLQG